MCVIVGRPVAVDFVVVVVQVLITVVVVVIIILWYAGWSLRILVLLTMMQGRMAAQRPSRVD